MINDTIMVISFIMVLIFTCKIYNLLMMKQYKEKEVLKSNRFKLSYISSTKRLELAGIKDDENVDYDISKAIKKINLTNNVRIKVGE